MIIRALNKIKEDIKVIYEKDPAAKNLAEVIFCYPGLQALISHRIAHKLAYWNVPLIPRLISYWTRIFTGIEIHPKASIGNRFFIDHGEGVVIGETTIIGDNCTLYQNVTLGGTGKDQGKRHPTLGSNVMVGSGAKVLGPVTIADNCAIAAGAVVLINLPENATAVGVPARIARINGKKISDTLDQIAPDDPINSEIEKLNEEINKLEEELKKLA